MADSSGERKLAYVQALNESIAQEMRADSSVFVAGEDVGFYGGVFGAFQGLFDEFGEQRVIDTPIAEKALVGLAVGAAVQGLRPIVDIMFMDFIAQAMDEVANQAAKLKYMFGGETSVPITITTMAGAGLSAAAQHSQSLEAWLCHIPGLKVVMPSNAYALKGLLTASIRDDNPTIVVCHKGLLGAKVAVPEDSYVVPLGQGRIVRPGSDLTVVATGRLVGEAVAAASALVDEGIEVEVIDPQTLQPFDINIVVESVRKTHHAVIVHEAVRFGGIGAEIASQIQEEAFFYLDAPVGRVGAPFSPVPFSPALENIYVPNRDGIAAAVRSALGARPSVAAG